jgi:hypothetical protein
VLSNVWGHNTDEGFIHFISSKYVGHLNINLILFTCERNAARFDGVSTFSTYLEISLTKHKLITNYFCRLVCLWPHTVWHKVYNNNNNNKTNKCISQTQHKFSTNSYRFRLQNRDCLRLHKKINVPYSPTIACLQFDTRWLK